MPKASDNIKIYRNPNGPVVSTVNRRVLEQDGLTFKDIDGTGTLSPVNDWRNSPAERAAAYVKTLSVKEKIAQLFISDWRMAKYPITGPMADLYKDIEKKTDETGILDEGEFRGKTIFGEQYLPGTSPLLKDWFNRHVILRANATPGSLETYHLPPFAAAVKAGTSSIMPYYSKPAAAKSAVQHDLAGNTVEMKPYGFAYNKYFIDTMLRGQMGFDGYINSDTGIAHNMAWGVEMLDVPERIGFAVTNAGVDIISGLFDNEAGMEAYNRGKNGYYETHPLPEGFAKEELTLTDEALDRAVARTLTELFALGMFENPYRDPDEAARIVATPSDWEAAADAHRRSVVLLKNDGSLPLTADKRANKKIYAEAFLKNAKHAADSTSALRKELADTCTLVNDPAQADFALLFVSPSSGEYFNATPGYLELDICEDKTVCNVDANGKPMADTHTETTLHGGKRLAEIAASVHANGGKVITNVNITLAWQLGNVEPLCDVLLAGFDTYRSATLDVIFGCFAPTGKLPLTLPRGDAVLAVNADGVCISPNDVPGYDKDRYMPDSLKDENGKAYAYRDAAGNYYEYGFGLEG